MNVDKCINKISFDFLLAINLLKVLDIRYQFTIHDIQSIKPLRYKIDVRHES